MPEPSRREREQQRKREEILEAALSVFAQKGYHGATMAQISQSSEYPLGTIYNFFPGKEQIYQELVLGKGRELGQILLDITGDEALSPMERIRKSMVGNAGFFVRNKEFIRIYIAGKSHVDAPLLTNFHKSVNKMHDKMIELYSDLFQKGIDAGEFMAYPSREMAALFSGIVNASIWVWLTEKEADAELANRLERAFTIFIGGIRKAAG